MIKVRVNRLIDLPGQPIPEGRLYPGDHSIEDRYLDHWGIKAAINAGWIDLMEVAPKEVPPFHVEQPEPEAQKEIPDQEPEPEGILGDQPPVHDPHADPYAEPEEIPPVQSESDKVDDILAGAKKGK